MRLMLVLMLAGCGSNGLPADNDGGALPDAAGRTCGELSGDVDQWLKTHLSCVADGDCTERPTRCGLPGSCGAILNLTGAAGLPSFLSAWDGLQCGATLRCGPCPLSPAQPAGCNAGICGHKTFSCSELKAQVQAFLDDKTHKSCTQPSDCVATSTACGLPGVCGAYVNQQSAAQLQALSNAFAAKGCENGQPCPDCAQPAGAACNQGVCGPL